MVADGGVRRARQPALADDGRDVRRGDPRALARQGDARLRRRLVLRAAGRRRAEDPGRRVRGGDDRGRARARGRPQGRARRGGARVRPRASTTSAASRDAYVRALEEAAGGEAVADAVLWRIAEAAAEVGLDDVAAELRGRGHARPGLGRLTSAGHGQSAGRASRRIVQHRAPASRTGLRRPSARRARARRSRRGSGSPGSSSSRSRSGSRSRGGSSRPGS